jgi:hypothetical protein
MDELKLYVYAYMIPSAFILSWATSFLILRVLPRLQVKEGKVGFRARRGHCVDSISPEPGIEGQGLFVRRESAGSHLELCIIKRHGAHRETGENGCQAVLEKYNWKREAKKLLTLYKELLAWHNPEVLL